SGCSDAQDVGNSVYNQVTGALRQLIDDGSLVTDLKASSQKVNNLLEAASSTGDFSQVIIPILGTWQMVPGLARIAELTLFPLSDVSGNYPPYMYLTGGYFETSLRACCHRYFHWALAECTGGTLPFLGGFYPNWGATEMKCLESSDEMPDYMRNNPSQWLYNDVETCCENYYHWDYNDCIAGSGGSSTSSATGKWFVNHLEEICHQDCPSSGNVTCGGLANSWDELYDSAFDCCSSQLSWLRPTDCESKSTHTTVVGSSNWYVDWGLDMCVKDCNDDSDRYCGKAHILLLSSQ
ncbi:hypothetical protein ACHAXR_009202, partial [Thalassiosira sp. AJA248-18]